jgi:hypothetical protein
MKIKLFTMVKDEVDIVEDWILYHGSLFGFDNLYVIDNYSTDGTYQILEKYQKNKKIFLIREKNYLNKGLYIKHLMKDRFNDKYDIAYPLDIDEFIVYYDKISKKVNPNKVIDYLSLLPHDVSVFKTNYIISLISNNTGYNNAVRESEFGIIHKYNKSAKSFFNNKLWNGKLDHGNHYSTNNYFMTDLYLIHYHNRNYEQIYKKTKNNLIGLGYKTDLQSLKEKLDKNENCIGNHHVSRMIDIINNNYKLNKFRYNNQKGIISLEPIKKYLESIK